MEGSCSSWQPTGLAELQVNGTDVISPSARKERLLSSIRKACARHARVRYGKKLSPKGLTRVRGLLERGAIRIWSMGYHFDDVCQIGDEHLLALKQDLQAAEFSPTTIAAYGNAFKTLARWQGRAGAFTVDF